MTNSKKKIKIDITIFAVIFVALIFFCLSPLLSKLFKTANELTSKKNALKTLENQITALQDFQNNNLAYQQNIQKIGKSFVSNESPVEFIGFLEKLANKYGLGFSLNSVKDVSEKKGNRATTAFQVMVVGDYPAVLIFLKKLEQSPWLIRIDQVDMNRVEDKTKLLGFPTAQDGQVVLKLTLETFSNYLGTTK
ncbi:MAG: hypothetical protein Q7R99_04425 [bacterium]|nr:hypothetical protein [bacterium]